MDTLMVFFTLRNEAVFLKDSAGGPGAAIAGTRSDRQWSEHSRNGSGTGDPRPRRSVTACRRQAPSVERGPERLRGGLPVSQAAGVRRCTRSSVGQGLRAVARVLVQWLGPAGGKR